MLCAADKFLLACRELNDTELAGFKQALQSVLAEQKVTLAMISVVPVTSTRRRTLLVRTHKLAPLFQPAASCIGSCTSRCCRPSHDQQIRSLHSRDALQDADSWSSWHGSARL